jgi:hypothetical protein
VGFIGDGDAVDQQTVLSGRVSQFALVQHMDAGKGMKTINGHGAVAENDILSIIIGVVEGDERVGGESCRRGGQNATACEAREQKFEAKNCFHTKLLCFLFTTSKIGHPAF